MSQTGLKIPARSYVTSHYLPPLRSTRRGRVIIASFNIHCKPQTPKPCLSCVTLYVTYE